VLSQVEDYDRRIPQDLAEKYWKLVKHGSSIPTRNCLDFIQWIPANFLFTGRNQPELIRKNPDNFRPEYCFYVSPIF
jgi:hypothetical protein